MRYISDCHEPFVGHVLCRMILGNNGATRLQWDQSVCVTHLQAVCWFFVVGHVWNVGIQPPLQMAVRGTVAWSVAPVSLGMKWMMHVSQWFHFYHPMGPRCTKHLAVGDQCAAHPVDLYVLKVAHYRSLCCSPLSGMFIVVAKYSQLKP